VTSATGGSSRSVAVVVTGADLEQVVACVDAVVATTSGRPIELVVSLERRAPDADAGLDALGARVDRLLVPDAPSSRAAARNAALSATTAEVACFLDGRALVCDGWLEPLVAGLDVPGVGACVPLLLDAQGRVVEAGAFLDAAGHLIVLDGEELAEAPVAGPVVACSGLVVATTRAVLEAAGGFDEGAFPLGGAEVDLSLGLLDRGLRLWLEPAAHVRACPHPPGATAALGEALDLDRLGARWPRLLEAFPSSVEPAMRRRAAALALAAADRLAAAPGRGPALPTVAGCSGDERIELGTENLEAQLARLRGPLAERHQAVVELRAMVDQRDATLAELFPSLELRFEEERRQLERTKRSVIVRLANLRRRPGAERRSADR
jgi:hypothetical protein